jgi:hypothetical protein
MIWTFLSCVATLDGSYTPPSLLPPSITDVSVLCEEEEWTFTLSTDAWTGNALLWLRDEDGEQEEHPLISQGAPRDGSSDELETELFVVGDWRDAQRGKSTRWPCTEQEKLSMMIEVYHPKTYTPTDCLTLGPLWPEDSAPIECDQNWE